MARQYPRFLFSNPSNSKSKGPFIVHTLNPVMIIQVSVRPPVALFKKPEEFYTTDSFYLYKCVEDYGLTGFGLHSYIQHSAMEWFSKQAEYLSCFERYFYNLIDDNGANAATSFYKFNVGEHFNYDGNTYRVSEWDREMILCERLDQIDRSYPHFLAIQ